MKSKGQDSSFKLQEKRMLDARGLTDRQKQIIEYRIENKISSRCHRNQNKDDRDLLPYPKDKSLKRKGNRGQNIIDFK